MIERLFRINTWQKGGLSYRKLSKKKVERKHLEPSKIFMKKEDRSFREYLEDMIESINKILKYLETVVDVNDFLNNEMVIDAVTRNYEIIGKAANKIPFEIKAKYPEVPWRLPLFCVEFA